MGTKNRTKRRSWLAQQIAEKCTNRVQVGARTYAGRPPQYKILNRPGLPPQAIKVSNGIPYVRVA